MTLAEYVSALIGRLADADVEAFARMRTVVGRRRARIMLDDEAVDIAFENGALTVRPAAAETRVDGEGATDRQTVVDLLDGRLEVTDAILLGRLRLAGAADDVVRMFVAIEILLDASARTPALQMLADAFRAEVGATSPFRAEGARGPRAGVPSAVRIREEEMLSRLGLLADDELA